GPLTHPVGEAIRRIHVVVSAQTEAVLVHAGAPVVAAPQEGSMQVDGRQDQFGHAADGNAGPAAGPALPSQRSSERRRPMTLLSTAVPAASRTLSAESAYRWQICCRPDCTLRRSVDVRQAS